MTRVTGRRNVLVAGTAALAMATGSLAAQAADIRGTVDFEGGQAIPKGQLQIYVDGAATGQKQAGAAPAQVESNGKATAIDFALPAPNLKSAAALEIVAQLQRADGWLLARGSAEYTPGAPMRITLFTVMY